MPLNTVGYMLKGPQKLELDYTQVEECLEQLRKVRGIVDTYESYIYMPAAPGASQLLQELEEWYDSQPKFDDFELYFHELRAMSFDDADLAKNIDEWNHSSSCDTTSKIDPDDSTQKVVFAGETVHSMRPSPLGPGYKMLMWFHYSEIGTILGVR